MKHRIEVTQTDTFYKVFEVEAESEQAAIDQVQKLVDENPIDTEKNTFEGSDVEVKALKTKG